jgi:hypothetical protein
LDFYFYARSTTAGGFTANTPAINLIKRVDGGPTVNWNASKTTPSSLGSATINSGEGRVYGTFLNPDISADEPNNLPRRAFYNPSEGNYGYESIMSTGFWSLMGSISWREWNSSLVVTTNPVTQSYGVYLGYKLNLESAQLAEV